MADDGSVTILLPLQARSSSGQALRWLATVELSHNSRVHFPDSLAAHFPQSYVGFSPIARAATLDVPGFEAWEIMADDKEMDKLRWLRDFAENIIVRKAAFEPQQIVCERKRTDTDLRRARCHASVGFMTSRYPKHDGLFFPYSVEFTLPGAAISSSSSLADVVQSRLYKFMVKAGGSPGVRGPADRP